MRFGTLALQIATNWGRTRALSELEAGDGAGGAVVGVRQFEPATVRAGDRLHDGEPEAGAVRAGDEALADAVDDGGREPGAVVADLDRGGAVRCDSKDRT